MSDRTDHDLLAAWCAGDEHAGNQLFLRHFDAIYRFFRRKVEHRAEDLVQETFLACVRNRHAFRGEASFRTYLFQIARSKLYDTLRQRVRAGVAVSMVSMAELRPSPRSWIAREQTHELLRLAMEELPIELQLAVELFYFEELSASDVATVLEIPEGTVRSRLRRAIATLRPAIQDHAGVEPQAAAMLEDLRVVAEAAPRRAAPLTVGEGRSRPSAAIAG